MIKIGCIANYNFPYKDEVKFARDNNFEILQIWYDKNGISLFEKEDPIKVILENPYPAIIHALLDINALDEHLPKLLKILKELHHDKLIIHPICRTEKYSDKTIIKLAEKLLNHIRFFEKQNIKLFIENNSLLDNLLNTTYEIKYLFEDDHLLNFILDIAHTTSEENLKDIISCKFPKMLHLADKHYSVIHEHLPVGEGELNFKKIFTKFLKDFDGYIILEIVQGKESLINSKKILEEIIKYK